MVKYYKLSQAAEKTGLSKGTIQRYGRENRINYRNIGGNKKLYDISTLVDEEVNEEKEDNEDKFICYCRVSTHGQKTDLQNQIDYMSKKYPNYEIITDIGSGINFKRQGLKKIIKYAINDQLRKLVVTYKDRLCRIGYDLIDYILTTYSKTEIVVDMDKTESINEEIANDLLQIIAVYNAKVNGMRSYSKDIIE